MTNEMKDLREFGKFRLDAFQKALWFENAPVDLPLKEIEVLCVLTENSGAVVTKQELLDKVWQDSFVEESNISRHIYLLRKMLRDHGEQRELIQTVARRGYRFTGEIRSHERDLVIERHVLEQTLIEEVDVPDPLTDMRETNNGVAWLTRRLAVLVCALALLVSLVGGFAVWRYSRPADKTNLAHLRSVAVLPLKSFDSNGDDEQLRLQITDSLITKFGNLKEISVRPTSAVIEFVKSEESSLEIGRRLRVDAVLDGRIQREGENLRINFQLISVADGAQIWSEQFNGRADQFLNFQDAISAKLLTKLSLPLSPNHLKIFEKRPTENVKAYEEYLQGRFEWNLRLEKRSEKLASARKHFEKAFELDPDFAVALAWLSTVVSIQASGGYIPLKEGLDLSKILASKAYELDPDSAETNAALGLAMSGESDHTVAERLFLQAIELNPNYIETYSWLSFVYLDRGESEKQIEIISAGRKIDPTSRALAYEHVVAYQAANRCDKSIELLPEAVTLYGDGNAEGKNDLEARTYSVCGKHEQALSILERVWKEDESKIPSSSFLSQLGYSNAKLGNREKALEFAKMIEAKKGSKVYENIAPIYLALGENEKVFRVLYEMTLKAPHRWRKLSHDLRLHSLKNEPRFIALNSNVNASR